jgi:predicted CopG family antitoxin
LGFKTIAVTEEVYKMLTMEKKGDESFSEVIKRLTKERGKLSDSLGAWKMTDEEAEQIFSSPKRHWKKSTVRIRGKAEHS